MIIDKNNPNYDLVRSGLPRSIIMWLLEEDKGFLIKEINHMEGCSTKNIKQNVKETQDFLQK